MQELAIARSLELPKRNLRTYWWAEPIIWQLNIKTKIPLQEALCELPSHTVNSLSLWGHAEEDAKALTYLTVWALLKSSCPLCFKLHEIVSRLEHGADYRWNGGVTVLRSLHLVERGPKSRFLLRMDYVVLP